ncbi:hypothetical protein BGZ95_001563 [Linnemannia exigua]|uniref:Methyltransferase type 11 domain-containing protein n=1 Tax=Linnemannia exigua TaxID=604196 RepID=A0AAD4D6P6_9FUNG|nr:hypothetical protein BGZ95_001563 [Linnemannia exigua]
MLKTTSVPMMAHNDDDEWSPKNYDKHASFVPALGAPVLRLLDPQSHERILDLGAGNGVLTIELEKHCSSVVAVDASAVMIQAARRIGCQDARVVDGHDLIEDTDLATGQFDAVFSNAALHWMKKDPERVIQGVNKCLKPEGRFVAECGGYMDLCEVRSGLHMALKKRGVKNPDEYDPWFFPGVNTYTRMLEQNGFRVEYIELIPRLTKLNSDIAGFIETFGFSFMKPFEGDEAMQKEIRDEVQSNLKFSQDEGTWSVMFVRLRFKAVKIN